MKKFILVLFVVISSCHGGGYSIIEPILKEVEGQIIQKITEKMNGIISETIGVDNFFKTQIETKEANKEKIISNITSLKADTTLKLKEAAQQNEVSTQLQALNTKINVLATEGRLQTLEEINAINVAEVGK